MAKNKLRLVIAGSEYYIATDDAPVYMEQLAAELNDSIEKMAKGNPRISQTMAAVLCALDYLDAYKKSEMGSDNLREQVKDYLEDSARARMEADVARREIERLNRELQTYRMKLADTNKGIR